jgi:hypothetical protein
MRGDSGLFLLPGWCRFSQIAGQSFIGHALDLALTQSSHIFPHELKIYIT